MKKSVEKIMQEKLMLLENFIDHLTSNEEERENWKECAAQYLEEDHVEGREGIEAALEEVNPNALTKASADFYDSIEITLCPNKTPIAYKRRLKELMNLGLDEQRAKEDIKFPIELEIVYAPEQGLFAVESEAMEATDIYNPYDGIMMNENED
jgi:hypothetical protein